MKPQAEKKNTLLLEASSGAHVMQFINHSSVSD